VNKTFLSLFSSLLLILTVVSTFLLLPSKKDKERLDQMRAIIENHEKEVTEIQQERSGVRKEIIVGSVDRRLQTKITAEKSIVDIEKKDGAYDLVEKLSEVTYVTQESLYPNHVVRVVKADTAYYHHRQEQITADHVTFYRYLIDQEAIPSSFEGITPSMQGNGDKLTVDLKGKGSYRLSRAHGQISEINNLKR
jgi:hypothetical protein